MLSMTWTTRSIEAVGSPVVGSPVGLKRRVKKKTYEFTLGEENFSNVTKKTNHPNCVSNHQISYDIAKRSSKKKMLCWYEFHNLKSFPRFGFWGNEWNLKPLPIDMVWFTLDSLVPKKWPNRLSISTWIPKGRCIKKFWHQKLKWNAVESRPLDLKWKSPWTLNTQLLVFWTISLYMGVSWNGETPPFTPQVLIISGRKTHELLGNPPHVAQGCWFSCVLLLRLEEMTDAMYGWLKKTREATLWGFGTLTGG